MLHHEVVRYVEVTSGDLSMVIPEQFDVAFCYSQPNLLNKLTAPIVYCVGKDLTSLGYTCVDRYKKLSCWITDEDDPPPCKTKMDGIVTELLASKVLFLFPRTLNLVVTAFRQKTNTTIVTNNKRLRKALISKALKESHLAI